MGVASALHVATRPARELTFVNAFQGGAANHYQVGGKVVKASRLSICGCRAVPLGRLDFLGRI